MPRLTWFTFALHTVREHFRQIELHVGLFDEEVLTHCSRSYLYKLNGPVRAVEA